MKCPKCNSEVLPGTKFCTSCGAPLNDVPKPLCPSCGAEIPADAKFCVNCGFKVQASSPLNDSNIPSGENPGGGGSVNIHEPAAETSGASQLTPDIASGQKKKKPDWWVILLIILVIGLAVALALVLTGKKNSSPRDNDYERTEITRIAEEPVDSINTVASEDPLLGSFTVRGNWNNLNVRLEIDVTVYPSGYVSASGFAYYGDSELCYRLIGGGEDSDTYSTLNLSEYSTDDNEYSGQWKGRVVYLDGNFNYSGTFYGADGSEYCTFDLDS